MCIDSYSTVTPCLKIKRNYAWLRIHWFIDSKCKMLFLLNLLRVWHLQDFVKFDLCVFLSPKESQKSYFAPRTCKICHILWQGGSEFQINETKVFYKRIIQELLECSWIIKGNKYSIPNSQNWRPKIWCILSKGQIKL